MSTDEPRWWGERALADGSGLQWHGETFALTLGRVGAEWRVGHAVPGAEERPNAIRVQLGSATLVDGAASADRIERHVLPPALDRARCLPVAADRSVVVRPVTRLTLAPGEDVRIFVSSPVWLRLEAGAPWQQICEEPSRRLSDTWFGSSNIEGELAYALRTPAAREPEAADDAAEGACRASTPVLIRNRADEPLPLERLNLPVPYLAIYGDRRGALWTQQVTMTRTDDVEMAALRVDPGPPDGAAGAELLSEARRSAEEHRLVRAFSGLLHVFGGGED